MKNALLLILASALIGALGIWALVLATEPVKVQPAPTTPNVVNVKTVPEDSYPVFIEDNCYLTYDGPYKALKADEPYDYHVKEYRCYQK